MELENPWGSADGSFRPFAQRNCEAVARLFLPLISQVDDSRIPWAEYLARREIPAQLDGYTEWSVVSELSGNGGDRRDSGFRPAPGSADTGTIVAVIDALDRSGCGLTRWKALVDPVFDGPSSATTNSLTEPGSPSSLHRSSIVNVIDSTRSMTTSSVDEQISRPVHPEPPVRVITAPDRQRVPPRGA